ncbi:C2 domain-containing protein [Tasmannia lanceolata]|uniref:C2 domain-containing protein n=1 Tax=Tasmannia lanceolata TaxID=3420 RepID=UPI004063D6F0
MARKRSRDFYRKEAVEFVNHVMEDKPLLPFLIPLVLLVWAIERWILQFSNWVPLAVAVWAMIEYARFQRRLLVEDLNKRWTRLILNTLPITAIEPCAWLNKLLMEVWPNFIDPLLSKRFSSIVEKRLKHHKPRIIERVELLEFSLGSCPPSLGQHGTHWSTMGDQPVMRMGFDWSTNDMSIMLLVKLAKPLLGTARIVVNSIHIKGDILLMPILDGQAILYSFESTPEVRIGVAFGSGGSQTLPATELPGVSTWLVKLCTDTLGKTMVEPRRRCLYLPSVDLRKKAVGGVLSVTVISATKLVGSTVKGGISEKRQNSSGNGHSSGGSGSRVLQTFVEVELEKLTRRTDVSQGSSPRWNATFNMVLHDNTGILRFHLYECGPNNVKYDFLTSCEIKVQYAADDSTIFWAVGPQSSVLAKHVECWGKEVQMVVPFEGTNLGELTVSLALREWQFSDGSNSSNSPAAHVKSQQSVYGSPNFQSRTGRKLRITVIEGRNLPGKEKSGKCDPYVKLQYGKNLQKSRTISNVTNPIWNQKFEFDEIGGGEYLKIKCHSADIFGDDNIGSARVNLEGLLEGLPRDVWVPLEKVNTGELRLQIEAAKIDDNGGSQMGSGNGWIELVLIEAKDLVAADLRGTSDPYVRVHYGNMKKRTKVVYKTLNPQWNQTLEFPDDGRPLALHVKDHNALLPTSSIGDCVVEYERLPPNQTADKWIPLQGVKNGEIHVQITRRVPELQKMSSVDSDISSSTKAHQTSDQARQIISTLQGLVDDGDLEGLSMALSQIESVEDAREEYILQLESEKKLLLNKIKELDLEMSRALPSSSKKLFYS